MLCSMLVGSGLCATSAFAQTPSVAESQTASVQSNAPAGAALGIDWNLFKNRSQGANRAQMTALNVFLNAGGGVGGKLWLADQSALVGSLGLGVSGASSSTGSANTTITNGNTGFSTSMGLRYEYHLLPGFRRFSPFFFAGGSLGYFTSQNTSSFNSSNNRESTNGSLNFGLNAGLGVECFITDWLSVQAQVGVYGSAATQLYNSQDSQNNSSSRNTSWGMNLATGGLTINFYFGDK